MVHDSALYFRTINDVHYYLLDLTPPPLLLLSLLTYFIIQVLVNLRLEIYGSKEIEFSLEMDDLDYFFLINFEFLYI